MAPKTSTHSEGQALVMMTLFLFCLLGAAAVAIDVGSWYWSKRQLQAAADASALAGAANLPISWSQAHSTAASQFGKNGTSGDTYTITNTTFQVANDSVTVTASREAPAYFAKVFGIDDAEIEVTARATVQSFTTFAGNGILPFGVMKNSYTPGAPYTIFGDGSSSNNGALSLPLESGSSCSTANGAADLKNNVTGTVEACPVSVNQVVDTKTGNNSGPIAQGLNGRMSGGWQSFSAIVQLQGNGQYTLLQPDSPQLVVIPVVETLAGGTTWPNGASQVRVIGFAYVVITGCGNPSKPGPCSTPDGKYVNGTFVGMLTPAEDGSITGAINTQNNTAAAVVLTS